MHTRYAILLTLFVSILAQSQCPGNLLPCGAACYDPNDYCCPNSQLTQKQFCSGNEATPTKGSSCPGLLKDCNGACYLESDYCCPNGQLIQKQFCSSSNPPPAVDICTGKQCPTGQSCCPTTYGATCYDASPFASLTCRSDDLGNANLCAAEEISCGQACYPIASFQCVNGAPQPRGPAAQLPGPNYVDNAGFEGSYFYPWMKSIQYDTYNVAVVSGNANTGSKSVQIRQDSFSQTVPAPSNGRFTLSFYLAAEAKAPADTQVFYVSWNGVQVGSYAKSSTSSMPYTLQSYDVQGAASGSNRLVFSAVSDGRAFYVDDVSLVAKN